MTDPGKRVEQLTQQVMYYLKFRSRSRQEVVTYLERKLNPDDPVDLIPMVMERLEQFNLLNDEEFARDWVKARLSKSKGSLLIRNELRQKGVARELIEESIGAVKKSEWQESALKAAKKKFGNYRGDKRAMRNEVYRFLYGRGFEAAIIETLIDDIGGQQ